MLIYLYDNNFLYAGFMEAPRNPIRKGEFLPPDNATTIAPPNNYTINEIPKFDIDFNDWYLVESPYKIAQDKEIEELKQKQLITPNEYGVALYELDTNGNVVERDPAIIEAENNQAIKEINIFDLKKVMDDNIINKAREVTGGSSLESIQAFISSYQLKAGNSSEYVSDGLVAHYTNGNYTKGDSLDTEAKISEYYKGLLLLLDKHRDTEIAAYLAAKAVL